VAVRVTDIERSTRFYVEAFGAEILTNPFVIDGEFAEMMMSGPEGVRFKLRQLRLTEGVIELYQFLEPAHPARPVHASEAGILHMGFQCDDVAATAARVEQAGGRLLMPVIAWGEWSLTFCADPDGNVIEIADASIKDLIRATIETFPEADPGTQG
jgi:glyoxylase I family protein